MNITTIAASHTPHTTILAVNDLVSGSHLFYTMMVGILVIAALLGGGARSVAAFFGGRIGETVLWAVIAIVVAVFIGSGYAIYMSTKRSVDQTGLTTGQFGR